MGNNLIDDIVARTIEQNNGVTMAYFRVSLHVDMLTWDNLLAYCYKSGFY